jgi:hypothetical protein
VAPVTTATIFDVYRAGDGGLSGNLVENDGLIGRAEAVMRVD